MEKYLSRLLIILILISTISSPVYLDPSGCMHAYSVGYWLQPCHTYYWVCEGCGDCSTNCIEYAVYVTCRGDNGTEYMVPRLRTVYCSGIPIII